MLNKFKICRIKFNKRQLFVMKQKMAIFTYKKVKEQQTRNEINKLVYKKKGKYIFHKSFVYRL